MYLYHATKFSNLNSIIQQGLKIGIDGLIYFTDNEDHSVNWIDLTNFQADDILLMRVKMSDLDESKIDDGYDHDLTFFRGVTVKTYCENIPFDLIDIEHMKQYSSGRTTLQ